MSSTGKALRYVACVVISLALAWGAAAEVAHTQTAQVGWDLHVANMHELYGVDFLLTYDASAVEVIDADLDRPGVQIEPGPLFTGQPYFVAYNRATVDHRTGVGTVSFVATLLNPAQPINGDGVIASVRYRVLESSVPPEALFTIEEVQLVSQGGRRMLVEWEGSVIRQVFRVYLPLLDAYPFIAPPETGAVAPRWAGHGPAQVVVQCGRHRNGAHPGPVATGDTQGAGHLQRCQGAVNMCGWDTLKHENDRWLVGLQRTSRQPGNDWLNGSRPK
ncbi:MAG: cohesin domain-containing protein [Anaerolineae bacterium]